MPLDFLHFALIVLIIIIIVIIVLLVIGSATIFCGRPGLGSFSAFFPSDRPLSAAVWNLASTTLTSTKANADDAPAAAAAAAAAAATSRPYSSMPAQQASMQ